MCSNAQVALADKHSLVIPSGWSGLRLLPLPAGEEVTPSLVFHTSPGAEGKRITEEEQELRRVSGYKIVRLHAENDLHVPSLI